MVQHWLIEKHDDNIELVNMTGYELMEKINAETSFKTDTLDNDFNAVFDWKMIKPHYSFFFDFVGNDSVLPALFRKSKLSEHSHLLIETTSSLPILRISTEYFIDHCLDFIDANSGMGSVIITDDYKLLMEFTDDWKYTLFSNFKIKL